MSLFAEPKDLMAGARRNLIETNDDLPTTFSEVHDAAFKSFRSEESSDSEQQHWLKQVEKREQIIKEKVGSLPPELEAYRGGSFTELGLAKYYREGEDTPQTTNSIKLAGAMDMVDKLREQYPEILSDDEMRAQIPIEAARIREESGQVIGRAEGFGKIGMVTGTFLGAMRDPLNILSMGIAAPAAGAHAVTTLAKVLHAAKVGAAFGVGIETAIQPSVYNFKKKIGVEYSVGDALMNIGFAGAGGGILLGAGTALVPGARAATRSLVSAYRKLVGKKPGMATPDAEAAAQVLEDIADVMEQNPLGPGAEKQTAHAEAVDKATADLLKGDRANVGNIVGKHEKDIPPEFKSDQDIFRAEQDIVNPIDTTKSKMDQAKQLRKLGEENKPMVDDFLKGIDKKFGSKSGTSFKDLEKIVSKASRPGILAKKPWHGVEHVRDSFRFKSVIKDIRQLPEMVKEMQKAGFRIIKADIAKMNKPQEWGWRIASFDLRMKNGQIVEYYLPVREMEVAKKAGNHKLFEKWRNRDFKKLKPEEFKAMQKDLATSRKRYGSAWKNYQSRVGLQDTAARAFLTKFDNSLGSLTGKKSSLRSSAVKARPADQVPSTKEAAKPSSKTITRPSSDLEAKAIKPPIGAVSKIPTDKDILADSDLLVKLVKSERLEADRLIDELGDDFQIPTEISVEELGKGRIQLKTQSAKEIIEELDKQEAGIKSVITCLLGGASAQA